MEEESVLVRNSLIFGISNLGKGDMIVMFSIKIGDIISRDVVLTQKVSRRLLLTATLLFNGDSYGTRVYAGA